MNKEKVVAEIRHYPLCSVVKLIQAGGEPLLVAGNLTKIQVDYSTKK